MIVQRRTVLVPEEYAGRRIGDHERERRGSGKLCVRRVGESAVRVRQLVLYRRSRKPVPIQGILLRYGNGLVLPKRQILRPQRRQVPQPRYHPRRQRRLAGV